MFGLPTEVWRRWVPQQVREYIRLNPFKKEDFRLILPFSQRGTKGDPWGKLFS
jgi:hypothetical protein